MGDISSLFWMIIIASLSGMLGLIMYHTAMLLRETTLTMRELKYILVELHDVLDSAKIFLEKANRAVDTVSSTVDAVSSSILQPLAVLGSWVNSVKGFVSKYTDE
jgi:hypothetical protein